MAEWPKLVAAEIVQIASDDEPKVAPIRPSVSVIPADLGRELYQALRSALAEIEGSYYSEENPEAFIRNALGRYEREVRDG